MITGERPRRGLKEEEDDRRREERGEDRELWRAVLTLDDADSPTFFPVASVDLSARLGADIVGKMTERFTNYDVNRFGVVESLELARFEGVEESEGDSVGDDEGEDFF